MQVETSELSFPPANLMREYAAIGPGFADRLLSMVEKEQSHRHSEDQADTKLEAQDSKRDHDRRDRGQWMAMGVCVLFVLAAFGLTYMGNTWAAVACVIVPLIVVACAFLNRTGQVHLDVDKRTAKVESTPDGD